MPKGDDSRMRGRQVALARSRHAVMALLAGTQVCMASAENVASGSLQYRSGNPIFGTGPASLPAFRPEILADTIGVPVRGFGVPVRGSSSLERSPLGVLAASKEGSKPSRDSLFDDEKDVDESIKDPSPRLTVPREKALERDVEDAIPGLRGFFQFEAARTISDPTHWSKLRSRADVGAQGRFSERVKWKVGARVDYDAVFDVTDFYPREVRRDQRFEAMLRENYLDFSGGEVEFRVGRQHIIWGEMVGLFFADVVSAKDLREFILPEFEVLRIPQWALRAEYFRDDIHAELLWIPAPTYDEIGKPGAEFFPAVIPPPPGFLTLFDNEHRPTRKLSNSNYGFRVSMLRNGWDLSGFYYDSIDSSPTFYRQIVMSPQPAFIYQPRHDRIHQIGGTLAKDFGSFVLKGEVVYTRGRNYPVTRFSDDDGVVKQNTLDWVTGLEFALPDDARFNIQAFQRTFFNHDSDIVPDRNETGFSILLAGKLADRVEAQVLWIASVNRKDWLLRPRIVWNVEKNWRLMFGVDILEGSPSGLFGQFDNRDRVYTEVRYSF